MIDAPIVVTVAMKPIVELITRRTSNVVQAGTNARKVPASSVPSFAMVPGIAAMDRTSTTVHAGHLNLPVEMDSVFQTIWCATKAQIAEINRTKEIVPAPEENSVATPVNAFLHSGDVI